MTRRLSVERIVLAIFSFSVFCNSYFMLMWSTYNNRAISLLAQVIAYAGTFLLLAFIIVSSTNKGKVHKSSLFIFALVILLEFHMNVFGSENTFPFTLAEFRFIVSILILFLLSNEQRKTIFQYIVKLFAIMVLPSVVYFLLNSVGVHLPYSVLNSEQSSKILSGTYYQHYPFGLIVSSPWTMSRLCGLFDEPGVVGTLSAIFISTNYDKISKKWTLLLLIEGILSFSMAFYLLMLIYIIVRAFLHGAIRFTITLSALVIMFLVFINTDFNNEYISSIQARIDVTSTYLFVDNRTSDSFDQEFSNFVEKGGYPLYMGNGKGSVSSNAVMSSSFSYKCLLYDYGIIGSILYLLVFFVTAFYFKIKRRNIPFLLVFLASIYQRPYVFNLQYYTIFVTALSFLENEMTDFEVRTKRIQNNE